MKTIPSCFNFGALLFLGRAFARTSVFGIRAALPVLAAALLVYLPAQAYPPSPYHLVYGIVRDEYGTPLMNGQARILLVSTGGSQSQTTIQPNLAVDVNYQLPVPMDTLLKPDLYRPNALPVAAGFRMYVVIGNVTNVPIISTSTTNYLGQPTRMTRIDLTLGVDSNGDGIPDAWELAFLAAIGSDLTLADLNAGLDVAHDGRTLLQEYLLGSAAFNPANPFAVRMVDFNGGASILEFPTEASQSYTVLGSTNLQQWAVLPFRLTREGVSALTRTNFTESVVETLQVQVVPSGPAPRAEFFRISSP
jgi:hypothetical protein